MTTQPYARCLDCAQTHATPADMAAHHAETLAVSIDRRSHAARVINPTPAEQARTRTRYIITDAIDGCMQRLTNAIDGGRTTVDDVTQALRYYPDLADVWADWNED